MAQLAFCCADSRGYLLDRRVSEVSDLSEARDYAKAFAQSLIGAAGLKDWKNCLIHVFDGGGEEQFVLPCAWANAKPSRRERFFVPFWKKSDAFQLYV
jgi:hypothetical protein